MIEKESVKENNYYSMKHSPPINSILLLIIILLVACYAAASIVHSDSPYRESMDLVGDYNAYQRKWMNEAWEMSHDKEFMYMMKAENGLLNHDRQGHSSNVGTDWGFCQINDYYHSELVNDPRFLSEPLWQLEQCYRLYRSGTKFYALERLRSDASFRAQIQSQFIFF